MCNENYCDSDYYENEAYYLQQEVYSLLDQVAELTAQLQEANSFVFDLTTRMEDANRRESSDTLAMIGTPEDQIAIGCARAYLDKYGVEK